MEIDLNTLAARDAHDLLSSAIIPRPPTDLVLPPRPSHLCIKKASFHAGPADTYGGAGLHVFVR